MSQKSGDGNGGGAGQPVAEWVTLGVSVTVVLVVISLVGYEYFTSSAQPPVIEARPQVGEVREVDGDYYLPVEVTNRGEQTAEDVKVQISHPGSGRAGILPVLHRIPCR